MTYVAPATQAANTKLASASWNGVVSDIIDINARIQNLTTAQRTALTPTIGDLVYDSTLKELFVYTNATGGNTWQGFGNVIVCASTTRPATPFDGQTIYENDTDKFLTYNGTSWIAVVTVGDTGTVTNLMLAGSITDSKLSTISTALKVSNSATTATNANTASAIVARDASGNFSAGTITANITGNVSGSSGSTTGNASTVTTNANLTGDVTSVGNATTITSLPDSKLATIATALKVSNSATTATSANTASAIVARDASGNFTAGTITSALTGTATKATNIVGGLGGSIPYQTAVDTTALLANGTAGQVVTSAGTTLAPTWTTATDANTASAIVKRDASGNFTAGTVTATNAVLTGYLQRTAPVSTAINLTVTATTTWVICTAVAVLTLGAATAGREILVKNTTAATVTSASANVVPLVGGAASTAILAATAGKFAILVGDGTNWIIMASN